MQPQNGLGACEQLPDERVTIHRFGRRRVTGGVVPAHRRRGGTAQAARRARSGTASGPEPGGRAETASPDQPIDVGRVRDGTQDRDEGKVDQPDGTVESTILITHWLTTAFDTPSVGFPQSLLPVSAWLPANSRNASGRL